MRSNIKILVTGAKGFVGKNLCVSLKNIRDGKDRTRPNISIGEIFEYWYRRRACASWWILREMWLCLQSRGGEPSEESRGIFARQFRFGSISTLESVSDICYLWFLCLCHSCFVFGQIFHAKIPLWAPLLSRNIPQSGTNQHLSRLSVRERTNDSRPAPNLSIHALDDIVCPDLQPVLWREIHVRQGLFNAVLHLFGEKDLGRSWRGRWVRGETWGENL